MPARRDSSTLPATNAAPATTSEAVELVRGYVVVMVIAFHSVMAYMASSPGKQTPFSSAPYDWIAHPIIDTHRWLGFDLFGASQFLHLMQLMCFLSGLFVWPSLLRKGAASFMSDRLMRLGLPFLLGVYLLMPLTYYPVYLVDAVDPSWTAYWTHWTELPFWPCGPLWFLAFLLALNAVAAAMCGVGGDRIRRGLARLSDLTAAHPLRFVAGFIAISAIAYLPMAAHFPPWRWVSYGPFSLQPGFSLQYAAYFFAGLVVGARGLERGVLAPGSLLMQRPWRWLAGAGAAFVVWITSAALMVKGLDGGSPLVPIVRECGLVLFAACACFGSIALALRLAPAARKPALKSIAANAYGIYLFHYSFMLWAQYALVPIELPAVIKGPLVIATTLGLAWATSAAINRLPLGARMMQGARRVAVAKPAVVVQGRPADFGPRN